MRGASVLWGCAILLAGPLSGCANVRLASSPTPAGVGASTIDSSPISSQPVTSNVPILMSARPVTTAPPVTAAPPVTSTTLALPTVGVVGVNDARCRSSMRPVVLLHGTFSTVASNFSAMVPALRSAHRCVFALAYGDGGIGPVTTSAAEFAEFVRTVRAVTGARQVDVVAYSQGGLVLRTGLRLDGLADQVAIAVLIAPSWNGTTSPLAGALPASLCPACADQMAESPLLRRLAVGSDLDGTVRYAEVSTKGDTVVTPIGSQVPTGPADRVRSLVVQDRCPLLDADHVRLPSVPGVIGWVVSALAADGRPSPAELAC